VVGRIRVKATSYDRCVSASHLPLGRWATLNMPIGVSPEIDIPVVSVVGTYNGKVDAGQIRLHVGAPPASRLEET
jgi:multidrug efflux pump subunit AcrB